MIAIARMSKGEPAEAANSEPDVAAGGMVQRLLVLVLEPELCVDRCVLQRETRVRRLEPHKQRSEAARTRFTEAC